MKVLKNVLNILSWPVYLCIAAYLLIAAPMILRYHPVVVLSGSMEPTYPVGSVIYYKAAAFDEIQEGDSITFYTGSGDAMITHRVVEKREVSEEFVTQGDANQSVDPNPVEYRRVAGKDGLLCLPFAGYYVTFGRQPAVIGAIVIILVLGILMDHLVPEKKQQDGKE